RPQVISVRLFLYRDPNASWNSLCLDWLVRYPQNPINLLSMLDVPRRGSGAILTLAVSHGLVCVFFAFFAVFVLCLPSPFICADPNRNSPRRLELTKIWIYGVMVAINELDVKSGY